MTPTTITGPAVTFDPDALHSWLAQPVPMPYWATEDDDPYTRADSLDIDDAFSRGSGNDLLNGLIGLLQALRDDGEQTAWRLADAVGHIEFFRTDDGETCDGALIYVDLANGLRLATLHQDFKDFASTEEAGVDAAVAGLTNIAQQANEVMRRYRDTVNAPF
jgi:hypothetical protein